MTSQYHASETKLVPSGYSLEEGSEELLPVGQDKGTTV